MKRSAVSQQPDEHQQTTAIDHRLKGWRWLRYLDSFWQARLPRAQYARTPLVEEFEPRLLYSTDFATDGLALASSTQITEQRVLDNSGEYVQDQSSKANTTEQRHELLIVDSSVSGIDELIAGLNTEGRSIEILILDANKDGIDQISAALAGRTDLSAIHIFSHGSDGQLQLGSAILNNSQLDARSAEIAKWGDALTDDADILLYGCDVASDAGGKSFVQHFATLTRADVAASDDLTGNTTLGGDWNLEYTSGNIESKLAFTASTQEQWTGLLETLANVTISNTDSNTSIATNPTTGAFVVTWTSNGNQDGDKDGVFARVYDASGNPVSGQILVNTITADNQNSSSVAMDASGNFVVVWQGKVADYGIYGQRFDATGTKIGSEFVVNQYIVGDQTNPSIAMASDGQFVVAWEDARNAGDIYVRHFSNTATALNNEILVNTNTSNGQFAPAVAIKDDGSYVVTWQSDSGGSGKAIFAQRFNAYEIIY